MKNILRVIFWPIAKFFIKIPVAIIKWFTHESIIFAFKISFILSFALTAIFISMPRGWIKYLILTSAGHFFINHPSFDTLLILLFESFCLIIITTVCDRPKLANIISPLVYSLGFNVSFLFFSWYTEIQQITTDSPGQTGYFIMFFIITFIFFAFTIQKNGSVVLRPVVRE